MCKVYLSSKLVGSKLKLKNCGKHNGILLLPTHSVVYPGEGSSFEHFFRLLLKKSVMKLQNASFDLFLWPCRGFALFILLALWNPSNFIIIFGAAYIPSLIMMLWATYMSRDALESAPIRANENCN